MPSKLDAKWFDRYAELARFSEINFLNHHNAKEQKELFLDHQLENPHFTYRIDLTELKNKANKLEDLKHEVSEQEDNQLVRDLYVQAIADKLTVLNLLGAVERADNLGVLERSVDLYGDVIKEDAIVCLSIIKALAEQFRVLPGESLQSLFGQIGDHKSVLDIKIPDQADPVTAVDIKQAFEQRLGELDLPWQVELSPEVVAITVRSVFDKKVLIPVSKTWDRAQLPGLVSHEIDVHVRRAEGGLQSPLLLLSLGLSRYLKGEEGLAMYQEMLSRPTKLPGVGNCLAVALARGVVDGQPKNFRQVFEVMVDYHHLWQQVLNQGRVTERSGPQIMNQAWDSTWRVFRGTTGNSLGQALTRDRLYFAGFSEVRNLFEQNDPELRRIWVGKYDPANHDHVAILDQLGL